MHDIDFDEIDRAINSVTPSSRATAPAAPAVDTKTPDVDAAVEDTSPTPVTPPAITTMHTAASMQTPAATNAPATSPAARRSTGRFMDVVHPSSDMRPGSGRSDVTSQSLTHTAPTFADITAPAPVQEPTLPAPVSTPDADDEPELTEGSAFHWPDPIDLHDAATQDETPEVVETPEVIDEPIAAQSTPDTVNDITPQPAVEDDEDDDINDIIAVPLESPFLSDAKVEKRPLGAFSTPEPITAETEPTAPLTPELPVQPEVVAVTESPDSLIEEVVPEKTHETSLEADPAIPRELHDDLLALDVHEKEDTGPVDAAVPVVTPVEDVPVGPTSITQQYKEQPSATEPVSGAIYDTATYHQPLTHPQKKRSSLLIIIWILAIIVVGGGLGLAFYLIALPMMH